MKMATATMTTHCERVRETHHKFNGFTCGRERKTKRRRRRRRERGEEHFVAFKIFPRRTNGLAPILRGEAAAAVA